jgi:hypothetical protein
MSPILEHSDPIMKLAGYQPTSADKESLLPEANLGCKIVLLDPRSIYVCVSAFGAQIGLLGAFKTCWFEEVNSMRMGKNLMTGFSASTPCNGHPNIFTSTQA